MHRNLQTKQLKFQFKLQSTLIFSLNKTEQSQNTSQIKKNRSIKSFFFVTPLRLGSDRE